MRPFATAALAVLLAVPATGFTFPSSSRRTRRVEVSESFSSSEIAASAEDIGKSTSYPADAFNGESTPEILEEKSPRPSGRKSGVIDVLEDTYSYHQPVDSIVRDLDGDPLSEEYLAEVMGIQNVEGFTCPESDAFRGFMSNACRVHLLPGGETAFYKRIVFSHLGHAWEKMKTAPFKLERDSKSYEVVASFLKSQACEQLVQKTGVHIPRCYDAKLEPNRSNPIESKFSFLLEDMSPSDGWYQVWLLHDMEECKATISMLAKMHAFFWEGSSFWDDKEAAKELEVGVWPSGSYVQPHAQNPDQCKIVAKEWAKKKMRFEKDLSPFDYWDNLGERLESVAEECGRLAHPFADEELSESYKSMRTFTHGDPKSANMFFRRSGESELEIGLIDYQWSGFGLAASDFAHFITSAVHADRLVDGGEEVLQKYYFEELQKYLVEYGAFSSADEALRSYSYETFIDQYDIAVLDLCRLIIAYTWDRFDEPVEKDDKEGCARTMNKTSYNKSVPNAVWLMSRCDGILKCKGV